LSGELNYTIDELLNKPMRWIEIVYTETMRQYQAKNGIEDKDIKDKKDKIISPTKLQKLGFGFKRGK